MIKKYVKAHGLSQIIALGYLCIFHENKFDKIQFDFL